MMKLPARLSLFNLILISALSGVSAAFFVEHYSGRIVRDKYENILREHTEWRQTYRGVEEISAEQAARQKTVNKLDRDASFYRARCEELKWQIQQLEKRKETLEADVPSYTVVDFGTPVPMLRSE